MLAVVVVMAAAVVNEFEGRACRVESLPKLSVPPTSTPRRQHLSSITLQAMADRSGMVDPAIFKTLQELVDQDTAVRDVSLASAASPTASFIDSLAEFYMDRNFVRSFRHWRSKVRLCPLQKDSNQYQLAH
jgi:hypothetical protein